MFVLEADTLSFHHPINNTAAGTAAKAVKEVGFGADDARRSFLFMERAAKGIILAVLLQRIALRLHQAHQ